MLTNRQIGLEIMAKDMGVSVEQLAADTNRCLYLDAAAVRGRVQAVASARSTWEVEK